MKEIGGYFGLELSAGDHFHSSALRFNSGRGALEYIVKARDIKKIHMPFFTCSAIRERLAKLSVEIQPYYINEALEFEVENFDESDAIIYINYFGLKTEFVKFISTKFNRLIIDNAQAFFEKPIVGVDTLYSPRKFFGVPDGGYLVTDKFLSGDIERDLSSSRASHLLERIDISAEEGYQSFLDSERVLGLEALKKMSRLTESLLASVNYQKVRETRMRNFRFLHNALSKDNELESSINFEIIDAPMIYPLLTKKDGLRSALIEKRIYIPSYWPNVLDYTKLGDWEFYLAKHLIPLPIDQRYSPKDLGRVVSIVKSWLK
jgi:hypothetical protein